MPNISVENSIFLSKMTQTMMNMSKAVQAEMNLIVTSIRQILIQVKEEEKKDLKLTKANLRKKSKRKKHKRKKKMNHKRKRHKNNNKKNKNFKLKRNKRRKTSLQKIRSKLNKNLREST